VQAKFEEWVIELPKALWQLGANHIGTSEVSIIILHSSIAVCVSLIYLALVDYPAFPAALVPAQRM
jgi:hypothetical protein